MATHHANVVLLIRIPQEVPHAAVVFEQFLVNLHEILHGHPVSFEILSYNQHIYFYAVLDEKYQELLEGQIYAIYPYAEIEVVKDYVNPEIIARGFAGTELFLQRSDILPIKEFHEFEADSLAGIVAVLTRAAQDDQAWIQILMRPIPDDWKLNFMRKLKMKLHSLRLFFRIKNYFKLQTAKGLRAMEMEASKKKSQKHAYGVMVRLAYVSSTQQRAANQLDALVKAFYQFNTIDLNQFRASGVKRSKGFFERFKRRVHDKEFILGDAEAATIFHLPDPQGVPHVVHVLAKKYEPPRDLPKAGVLNPEEVSVFGTTNFHNQNFDFGIKRVDRRRHLYIVGKSGTGKSKLLELLIRADILAGHGIGILDPHGDLVDAVLRYIPKERIGDVVLFNPADIDHPVSFNPLEQVPPEYRVRVTIGFIEIFHKIFGSNWTPRLEHVLRYTTLALLDSPNTTVLSILKMLSDKNYRQKIVARIDDSVVKNFWVNEFAAWSEKFDNEAIMPILNKVGQFVSTSLIRNIIGQTENKIDLRRIMDDGKILLCRLSKGFLGEENTQLLGAMFITKIYQAAMGRTDTPEEQRRDFYLYADEFQYFATDTFGEILSEARKYHLNLTMAHQYMGQLSDFIRKTAFGNVGSIINFRVGAEDAAILENEYSPIFKVRDIINLGVREFYTKISIDGEMRDAFSGRTISIPRVEKEYVDEIVKQSREKYARHRTDVVEELKKWDEAAMSSEPALTATLEEKFAEPLI